MLRRKGDVRAPGELNPCQPFSTDVYMQLNLTLIPSASYPQRDCDSKGVMTTVFLGTPFRLRDIPRDPGIYPGTKRYYVYGMWPPRDVFARERELHFLVARERDVRLCAGRAFAGTRDFTFITGPRVFFRTGFDCCGASDTFTHLIRNVAQFRMLWAVVGSCSRPQVKCKRSAVFFFFVFLVFFRAGHVYAGTGKYRFARDAFVRARDFILIAGPWEVIPNPVTNRGKKIPRNALVLYNPFETPK